MNQDAFQQQLSNSSYKLNQEIDALNKNNDFYFFIGIFIASVVIGAVITSVFIGFISSFKKTKSKG